jgi:hypothetical protein
MQLTDRLLVEVGMLLIGLTQIALTKFSFNHPSVIKCGAKKAKLAHVVRSMHL